MGLSRSRFDAWRDRPASVASTTCDIGKPTFKVAQVGTAGQMVAHQEGGMHVE